MHVVERVERVERVEQSRMPRHHEEGEQTVVHRLATSDTIGLQDVVREPVDAMAERMKEQADEFLDQLKAELRDILGGVAGPHNREDFVMLQEILQARQDVTQDALMRAHRAQLEILVAVKTGIQAFLHPTVSVTHTAMVEVFLHARCRNIACQNQLPSDNCSCQVCAANTGFCNACMCIVCNKFDFDVNTCRWVGCDCCLHWSHTDCAIRDGQICMGPSLRSGDGGGKAADVEMIFRCKACRSTSELLGWVKDVFRSCAAQWEHDIFMKEVDCVRRIFHGSEDSRGKRLYWKAEEVLERLKTGLGTEAAAQDMLGFFKEVESDDGDGLDGEGGRDMEPREACNRIAEVVQEAVAKMQSFAEEKAQDKKKARLALEMCDRELEDKRKELEELQFDKKRKRQQIEELEGIVKLKQAEADMFQTRADEARREADGLQRIVLAKSEKVEEEYATSLARLWNHGAPRAERVTTPHWLPLSLSPRTLSLLPFLAGLACHRPASAYVELSPCALVVHPFSWCSLLPAVSVRVASPCCFCPRGGLLASLLAFPDGALASPRPHRGLERLRRAGERSRFRARDAHGGEAHPEGAAGPAEGSADLVQRRPRGGGSLPLAGYHHGAEREPLRRRRLLCHDPLPARLPLQAAQGQLPDEGLSP